MFVGFSGVFVRFGGVFVALGGVFVAFIGLPRNTLICVFQWRTWNCCALSAHRLVVLK